MADWGERDLKNTNMRSSSKGIKTLLPLAPVGLLLVVAKGLQTATELHQRGIDVDSLFEFFPSILVSRRK